MKTPDQAAAKWVANAGNAQSTWSENLQNTSKPIVSAAIAARDRMVSGFNQATQAGGVWERNLAAVGDAGIKAAAQKKASNYGTGITNGKENQAAAIQKIMAYESAGMSGLAAIPKGGIGQSKARAAYWIDYMAAGRGKLGAK